MEPMNTAYLVNNYGRNITLVSYDKRTAKTLTGVVKIRDIFGHSYSCNTRYPLEKFEFNFQDAVDRQLKGLSYEHDTLMKDLLRNNAQQLIVQGLTPDSGIGVR